MKSTIVFTVISLFLIGIAGCASSSSVTKGTSGETTMSKIESAAKAFPGGNLWTTEDGTKYYKCPVMGGEGKIEEAEAYSDIQEIRIYHCCAPCQGPFRSNPAKYLSELTLPGNIIAVTESGEKMFRDPVSGVEGQVDGDTRYVDHNYKRYYFSDRKTVKHFENAPEKFILDK